MIGAWGFLEELGFAVFPLVLLLLVILGARRSRSGNTRFSLKGTAILLVLIALPLVLGWSFAREAREHFFLISITPEQVESFTIGTQQVTKPGEVSVLVQALQTSEWFSSHHDGWARPVDFRIKLKGGQERFFRVAAYLRAPGAVIDLGSSDIRHGPHPGYAFSKSLPGALTEIGITLPQQ